MPTYQISATRTEIYHVKAESMEVAMDMILDDDDIVDSETHNISLDYEVDEHGEEIVK